MPTPKKQQMRGETVGGRGASASNAGRSAARKPVVKVQPRPNTKAAPKSNVKVKPSSKTTAPKTGLENRGAKLTRAQRSERANDYYFDKAERRWEGEHYVNYSGLRGPKNKGIRGEGVRSQRRTEAIRKEAKPVVKINSQENLKK